MRWLIGVWLGTLAAIATVTMASAATAPAVSVQPPSGPEGQALTATYTYSPQGTRLGCTGTVTWTFGNISWAQSSVSGSRTCTSTTGPLPPPAGLRPATYQVCGSDPFVGSKCAPYQITAPAPSPSPTPRTSPSPGASPSPHPTPSPSPSASPGPTPGSSAVAAPTPSGSPAAGSGSASSGGPLAIPRGAAGGLPGWPWSAGMFLLAALVAAAVIRVRRSGWPLAGLLHASGPDPAELMAAKVTYRSSALPPDRADDGPSE